MRVIVTGNLGYIGPVLVRRLREAGHRVTGIDLGWYVGQYATDPEWPDLQYFADIREVRPSWFRGFDAAVHLAGLSNDPMGELDPSLTSRVNYEGTVGMLMPGIRNVVVSSCSVYGATTEIATERTPINPQTAYARAKADVDNWLTTFGATVGITNWASLRLGTVWGFSPGHRLDLVVNKMTYDAIRLGRIRATGNAARPLVHVEDVADAIVTFLENDKQGVFNIVGENIRMFDLAERVAEVAGLLGAEWIPVVREPASGDTRDYRASQAKALAEVNWKAHYTLDDGLADLYALTQRLPQDRIYQRLPIAQRHLEKTAA